MPSVSVIVCAHNPRRDYFEQTLRALRAQSLATGEWELLIIDSASAVPLAEAWDVGWHADARHIREERVGLTNARLRGIHESRGDILVFVDDDNVLDPGYLEQCIAILARIPCLGAFGAAQIEPVFDSPPRPELARFVRLLAVRDSRADHWSNDPLNKESTPYGAGLAVRRDVAARYARDVPKCRWRSNLDRSGDILMSGGDLDFSFVACQMSYGIGVFRELRLKHLIPSSRIDLRYFEKLMYGHQYSRTLLIAAHGLPVTIDATLRLGFLFHPAVWLFRDAAGRAILKASRRGVLAALRDLKEIGCAPDVIIKRG